MHIQYQTFQVGNYKLNTHYHNKSNRQKIFCNVFIMFCIGWPWVYLFSIEVSTQKTLKEHAALHSIGPTSIPHSHSALQKIM